MLCQDGRDHLSLGFESYAKSKIEFLLMIMIIKGKMYYYLEIRGLRSTKCSNETLQNLLYFMYEKTHVFFFCFSFRATLYFYLMNALVYVDTKCVKNYMGFLIHKI